MAPRSSSMDPRLPPHAWLFSFSCEHKTRGSRESPEGKKPRASATRCVAHACSSHRAPAASAQTPPLREAVSSRQAPVSAFPGGRGFCAPLHPCPLLPSSVSATSKAVPHPLGSALPLELLGLAGGWLRSWGAARTLNFMGPVKSEWKPLSCVSLQPHGLYSPWNSPSQNTGVGSLSLLQGTFPPRSPTLQADSLPAEPTGSPWNRVAALNPGELGSPQHLCQPGAPTGGFKAKQSPGMSLWVPPTQDQGAPARASLESSNHHLSRRGGVPHWELR